MVEKCKTILRSAVILVTALLVAGVVVYFFLDAKIPSFLTGKNSDHTLLDSGAGKYAEQCKEFVSNKNNDDKVAVLRIDDVQAWAWGDTTRLMIDDAFARNAPLTLGIVPKHFSEDPALVSFLQARECNLEIALHGWDHAVQDDGITPEFVGLSYTVAKERLQRGATELQKHFMSPLETWIPPQNEHSSGTASAATEIGFTRFSTEGEAGWDYDATTWDYDTNLLVSPSETIAKCEESVVADGVCIIMLHPQNYTVNDEYNEELYHRYYIALLDSLVSEGYTFARFMDLDSVE